MKQQVLWGSFLCFIAAASWGAMFPVAHAAFHYIDPFYFTLIRYGAVAIILVVLLFLKEGKKAFKTEGKGLQIWFLGTMAFTIYNLLIFWGQDLLGESGVMTASVMESMMPMISIVIFWFILKQRPYAFTLICISGSFIGALLVITKGDVLALITATENIFANTLILIAVIGWVIYTMGGDKFRGWSILRYSTLTCLYGTVTAGVIVVLATMTGYVTIPTMEVLQATAPHLLFMIIFPGLIALLGWNIGVSKLSSINALLFINFVPITTLAVSLIQGYAITAFDIIGTVFIISALVANNLFVRWQHQAFSQRKQPAIVTSELIIERK